MYARMVRNGLCRHGRGLRQVEAQADVSRQRRNRKPERRSPIGPPSAHPAVSATATSRTRAAPLVQRLLGFRAVPARERGRAPRPPARYPKNACKARHDGQDPLPRFSRKACDNPAEAGGRKVTRPTCRQLAPASLQGAADRRPGRRQKRATGVKTTARSARRSCRAET